MPDEAGLGATVFDLESFGLGDGRPKSHGDVIGDVIAADRKDRSVNDAP